jgi:hypothetical protein
MHRLINYDQSIIDSYNNDVNNILTNIRDFVALHYATSRSDTDFWKDVQKTALPDTISEKLERWRNRLPIKEDFNSITSYAMFTDAHHIFILNGLGLFNVDSIKNEFESQCILTKNEADAIIRNNNLHEDTIRVLPHKEIIRRIRG